MVGELIMLPVRVGVGATRLSLRVAGQSVALAANATAKVVDTVTGRRTVTDRRGGLGIPRPPEQRDRAIERTRSPETSARTSPPPRDEPPSAPPPRTAEQAFKASPPPRDRTPEEPSPSEPTHVSEEPVLVEETAEPGAEDGAGAELHVEAPWSGYERMTAKQVVARLAKASTAELAAVQLYESGHRGRQTILTAVGRELRGANGSGRRSQERGSRPNA